MKSFCYLEDRLNANGGSEAVMAARSRTKWIKFRHCGQLLYERRLWLKIKGFITAM